MEAIAPAALALSVSLDAVASLSLVILSYQGGTFMKAMLPMTDDVRLNIATGVHGGDPGKGVPGVSCMAGCQHEQRV